MKNFITIISLLIFGLLSSQVKTKTVVGNGIQKEEIKNISDYNSVEVTGPFNIILTDKNQGEIRIIADENILPLISIYKKDVKELVIGSLKNSSFNTKNHIKIYIPAQNITSLKSIGSGNVSNVGVLKAEHFVCELSGSGNIKLNIDVEKFNADLVGSGNMLIVGEATNVKYEYLGSGNVNAEKLITKNTEVDYAGSGNMKLYVTDTFSGEMLGSGNLIIKGNPKHKNYKDKGSGNIYFKE
ncbi:MAG: head GIN domain-containing protein [Bergeyella zoohelcum]|nr:head GIN domain-containing protein [Bergeyella zoohelcum]